ncbi:MAG: alpha-ribazole phosphatase [Mangrovibacterium sp.]
MKNIYLIRHPKTEAPEGVCYGRSEVMPNAEMLHDAEKKVRKKLEDVAVDACYTSPLGRCVHLAEQLFDASQINTENALQEMDFASWEMTPWSEIPEEQQRAWGADFIHCRIHGGENFMDVQQRAVCFWNELVKTEHREILLFTHAGVIRALLSHLLDAAPQKIFAIEVDYADVIQIKWSNDAYYKVNFL